MTGNRSRVALSVEDLRVHYHTERGAIRAVEGVSFDLLAGEQAAAGCYGLPDRLRWSLSL